MIEVFVQRFLKVKFLHRIASDMDVDDRIYTLISKFEARMYRLGVKMADHISCQNEYQFKAMKKKYPDKNIFISHNPFRVKAPLKITEREYIAWIGNFRHAKKYSRSCRCCGETSSIQVQNSGR